MNLCFVTHRAETADGIGVHYYRLAEEIVQRGHSVHFIVFPSYCPPQNHYRIENGIHCYQYSPPTPTLFYKPGIGRVLKSLKVLNWYYFYYKQKLNTRFIDNIIDIHNIILIESTNAQGLLASYSRRNKHLPICVRVSTLGVDVAHYEGGGQSTYEKQLWKAEQETIRRSDCLVTHTRAHRRLVCQKLKLDEQLFKIIPHGIKIPSNYETKGSDIKDLQLLFVGRFDKRKGVDVLLRSIPCVMQSCPQVKFNLVGQDPENRYEKNFFCSNPHLRDRVFFHGFISNEEVTRHYEKCDLLVAPSLYESFGQIYLEAMSHGKPVIGCNAGGIPEVIEDGVCGLLAKPGCIDSLTDKIIKICNNKKYRRLLGKQALERVKKLFDIKNVGDDTLELYEHMLSHTKKRIGS